MMKSIFFSAFVAFCSVPVLAQRPVYPAKEQVLKDARSGYALSRIQQIYNAPIGWDKIKLENKTFVNGGEKVDNFFVDYESDVSKRLGLDIYDATDVHVLATTPKDKEGYYYEIIITVTYSSYNATVPLNKWVFKEAQVKSNDYNQKGGSRTTDDKRMAEVLSVLKKYKGNAVKDPKINFDVRDDETKIITIDSIYKNPERKDELLTYQRFWYYTAKCKTVNYEDRGVTIDAYYDATVDFYIEWSKPENGDNNSWTVETVSFGPVNTIDHSRKAPSKEELASTQRYKSLDKHGFEAVYKKKSTFERSRNSVVDLKIFDNKLEAALTKMYENPEEGKTALAGLVNPQSPDKDAIVNSFYQQITDAKKYMCTLKEVRIGIADYASMEDGEVKFGSTFISVNLERKNAIGDKELAKKYKDAGVSKETLKNNGGDLDISIQAEDPEIVLVNNNWYLSTAAKPHEKKLD